MPNRRKIDILQQNQSVRGSSKALTVPPELCQFYHCVCSNFEHGEVKSPIFSMVYLGVAKKPQGVVILTQEGGKEMG